MHKLHILQNHISFEPEIETVFFSTHIHRRVRGMHRKRTTCFAYDSSSTVRTMNTMKVILDL